MGQGTARPPFPPVLDLEILVFLTDRELTQPPANSSLSLILFFPFLVSWQSEHTVSKPRYIFLDQNHWIYLAKAFWGQPHVAAHSAVAQDLLSRVDRDEVRLPLSVIHLIEHLRAEEPGRRARLAEVFERFSCGWFVAAWSDILPAEISRAIAFTFCSTHLPPPPETFGRGFLFGVGPKARSAFPPDWSDIDLKRLGWFAAQPGALFDLLTFRNEEGRVAQKEDISEFASRNAQAAEALRAVRKPYAKLIQTRAQLAGYTYDLQNQISPELAQIGKTFEDFLRLGIDGLTEFFSRIPTLDVDCELTLYRDRQWSRRIQQNDVNDIGHLVIAIPYCDAVVVERFWARAIQETSLKEKYRTAVCADLTQLTEIMAG